MNRLSFSLSDYQTSLEDGHYLPPRSLCPYYDVDPVLYRQHGTTKQRRGDLSRAMDELSKRTGPTYYGEVYPLQARTLVYSSSSFPAYRFILPEVITEDWLAIVDWGKFQRDHVLHQPLCGYIVLKLLDCVYGMPFQPNGQTFLDACVNRILRWEETKYIKEFLLSCGMREDDPILVANNPIAKEAWRIFFREAAYVAAIFHDLGYPWQYAERIQGNLDGMNTTALRQNRSAKDVVGSFGHRMLFRVLEGYRTQDAACPSNWHEKIVQLTDTALTTTHGFPGALGFLHLNDCVRRFPSRQESPMRLLCIEWAAVAIMMHDMAKIYWGKGGSTDGVPENPFLRLSFNRDPLSAIVTFADIMQEFDRPTASFGTCSHNEEGIESVTLKYPPACTGTELRLDDNVLTIKYNMNNEESRAIKRNSLQKEIRQNFDVQYGYLDMRSLGIDEVQVFAD